MGRRSTFKLIYFVSYGHNAVPTVHTLAADNYCRCSVCGQVGTPCRVKGGIIRGYLGFIHRSNDRKFNFKAHTGIFIVSLVSKVQTCRYGTFIVAYKDYLFILLSESLISSLDLAAPGLYLSWNWNWHRFYI